MYAKILEGVFYITLTKEEEARVRKFNPSGFDWTQAIDGRDPYDYDDMGDGRWSVTFHVSPIPDDVKAELDEDEFISLCAVTLDDAGFSYDMCNKKKTIEDLSDRDYKVTVRPY